MEEHTVIICNWNMADRELMFHTIIYIIIVYPMSMIMPMLRIPSISLVTRPFSVALHVLLITSTWKERLGTLDHDYDAKCFRERFKSVATYCYFLAYSDLHCL